MKTTQIVSKIVKTIGCANGFGGRQLGCENAAKVLKNSKILSKIENCVKLEWGPIVDEIRTGRHLKAMEGITETCRQLAHHSRIIIENREDLLVFGGDHSCAIGTWSGVATALRPIGDIGLIWIDAHMDAHTPETSESGNLHGMPVAHLLGYGEKNLRNIGDGMPKLKPHNLCMVGIRDFEKSEQKFLESLGVRIFYADEVNQRGVSEIMQEAQYLVSRNTIGYGLSIDIDGFDIEFAPAVGTPAENGINALEFVKCLLTIDLTKLVATEIVEFLPKFDDKKRTSEQLIANLVEFIYRTKEFQLNGIREINEKVRRSCLDEEEEEEVRTRI